MRVEHIGDATLYLGDCLDILPTLGHVDAVVTDPPYGIDVCTKGGIKARGYRPYARRLPAHNWPKVLGDDRPFDPRPVLEIAHQVILWGANHYSDKIPVSHCWLVWDRKTDRGAKSSITDCELAWTRGPLYKTTRIFRHMWAGFQRDSEVGEPAIHPTQKPIALMAWCLSFVDGSILDPYMGCGPTGVACANLGRKFIGIEIEEKYFDIACQRIADAYKQPRLFKDKPVRPTQQELI